MGSRESKAATLIHLRPLSASRFAAGAGETVGLGKLGCAEAATPGRRGALFSPPEGRTAVAAVWRAETEGRPLLAGARLGRCKCSEEGGLIGPGWGGEEGGGDCAPACLIRGWLSGSWGRGHTSRVTAGPGSALLG